MINTMKKTLLTASLIGLCAGTLWAQAGNVILTGSDYCRSRARFGAERISPASLKDDEPRLLTADLTGAKELKLVTVDINQNSAAVDTRWWGPTFYK